MHRNSKEKKEKNEKDTVHPDKNVTLKEPEKKSSDPLEKKIDTKDTRATEEKKGQGNKNKFKNLKEEK